MLRYHAHVILSNKFNKHPIFFNKTGFPDTKKRIFAVMEPVQQGLINQIWQITLQILPYLCLLLLHHFLLAPLFFKKKYLIYIPVTIALITAFGFYCYNVGNPVNSRQGPPPMMRDGNMPPPKPMDDMRPPMEGMAPPPDDMRPPMDGNRPPRDDMRPPQMHGDGNRPMRPETMKLLMGLLLIGVDLGFMAYIRSIKHERLNNDLRAENQLHKDKIQELNRTVDNVQKAESELLFKTDYKQVRIKPDDILYIEGMAEYLKIIYTGSPTPLIVHLSMKRLLEQLPDDRFIRIHKSYIVNLNRISDSSRTQVTIENGTTLPIGESYRKLFAERHINS